MDDMEVPITEDPDRDPSGLYRREPSAYNDAPQDEPQQQIAQDEPQEPAYQLPPPQYQPPPQQYQAPQYQPQQYQPPQQAYVPPAPVQAYVMPVYVAPAPTVYVYAAPPPPPVQVYMYEPPTVAMWSQPRTIMYPNSIGYRTVYPYGY
jgi:hypothetical protein